MMMTLNLETLSAGSLYASTLAAALATYIVYNLFFHPLAKFPGPLLCRCGLYDCQLVFAFKREASFRFEALHVTYGTYVRISPNMISTIDPEAWKELYKIHTKWEKSRMYNFFRVGTTKNLISEIDESRHSSMRRILAPSYTESSLRQLEYHMDEMITLLDKKLEPILQAGKPWHAGDWLKFLSIDIKGKITFGKSYGLVEAGKDDYGLLKAMDMNLYLSVLQGMLPAWLGRPWRALMFAMTPLISQGPILLRSVTISSVKETQRQLRKEGALDDERKDVLQRGQKWRVLSFGESCTHTATIIGGGADSTAIAMRSVLYYTLTTPRVYDKLMQGLADAYEAGRISQPIQYSEAIQLPYLQATIKESMRHFVGGSVPWPRISPEGGAILGGHYLPKGTYVGVPSYPFHKRAFGPDSEQFRPERWIQGKEEDHETFRKTS